jgi:hypothetical protein
MCKLLSGTIMGLVGLTFGLVGLIVIYIGSKLEANKLITQEELSTVGSGSYAVKIDNLSDLKSELTGMNYTVNMEKMTIHKGVSKSYDKNHIGCIKLPTLEYVFNNQKFNLTTLYDVFSKDPKNRYVKLASSKQELDLVPFQEYSNLILKDENEQLKTLRFEEALTTSKTVYLVGNFKKVGSEIDDFDYSELYEVSNGDFYDDLDLVINQLKAVRMRFIVPSLILFLTSTLMFLLVYFNLIGF